MSLASVLTQVGAVVVALHFLALAAVVGRDGLADAPPTLRANLRAVAPTLAALVVVLAVNGAVRDVGVELSWLTSPATSTPSRGSWSPSSSHSGRRR